VPEPPEGHGQDVEGVPCGHAALILLSSVRHALAAACGTTPFPSEWSPIQLLCLHMSDKHGRAVGLSFNNTHKLVVGSGEFDSEVKPTRTCA
jgi:hypothetical protein